MPSWLHTSATSISVCCGLWNHSWIHEVATVKSVAKCLLSLDNLLKVGGVSVSHLGKSQVRLCSSELGTEWSSDCWHTMPSSFLRAGPLELCAPWACCFLTPYSPAHPAWPLRHLKRAWSCLPMALGYWHGFRFLQKPTPVGGIPCLGMTWFYFFLIIGAQPYGVSLSREFVSIIIFSFP